MAQHFTAATTQAAMLENYLILNLSHHNILSLAATLYFVTTALKFSVDSFVQTFACLKNTRLDPTQVRLFKKHVSPTRRETGKQVFLVTFCHTYKEFYRKKMNTC